MTEQRRHQRVPVSLLGRYMLSDRREYPCQTIDMSPGGLAVVAPVPGELDERIVVYLEHVGRIEGKIVRILDNGFAMTVQATARKRDKLAAQLTWLANRHALGLPEDRRHERIVPRVQTSQLSLEDGRRLTVRLLDISMSGAAISCDIKPPIGTPVTVGRTPAKIVRHFDGGIAVEFRMVFSPSVFSDQIVL